MNIVQIGQILEENSTAEFDFCMAEILIKRMKFTYATHNIKKNLEGYQQELILKLHNINNKKYEYFDTLKLIILVSKIVAVLNVIPLKNNQEQINDLHYFLLMGEWLDKIGVGY